MKRWLGASRILAVALLSLWIAGCSALAATPAPRMAESPRPLTATPSLPIAPSPTPLPSPTPTATPTPDNLWIEAADVRVHPDGGLASGDVVSFQVQAHNGSRADLSHVPFVVDWGSGQATGKIVSLPHGSNGTADLPWVWDTTAVSGTRAVTVTLDPENVTGDPGTSNNVAVLRLELAANRPANEIGATWRTTTSTCCTFHYVGGTAAARDIQAIVRVADEAMAFVEERLNVQQTRPLEVYLLSRVLGHGGFAGETIAISYVDRDYSGGGLLEVFRHEGTHVLDRRLAGGERPALLAEGFAVYVTGGHFKLESLPERAAALLKSGRYIPLRDLANSFYPSQHESGYLEGGAFIDYLVQRDGFRTFVELYDGMRRQSGESDADMIDREMQAVYGSGLAELEREWQTYLRTLAVGDETRDVIDTIALYDTVRRYQRALDPSAYFLGAWIPDLPQARSRGLVADSVRHPRAPENIALETMLIAAHQAFAAQADDQGEQLLASVNAVLDAGVAFVEPLAARYLALVRAALASGYEPQRISIADDRAQVWATRAGSSALLPLTAALHDGAWRVR